MLVRRLCMTNLRGYGKEIEIDFLMRSLRVKSRLKLYVECPILRNILERKIGIAWVFSSDELERAGNNVYYRKWGACSEIAWKF
jgi:hypothetical protein